MRVSLSFWKLCSATAMDLVKWTSLCESRVEFSRDGVEARLGFVVAVKEIRYFIRGYPWVLVHKTPHFEWSAPAKERRNESTILQRRRTQCFIRRSSFRHDHRHWVPIWLFAFITPYSFLASTPYSFLACRKWIKSLRNQNAQKVSFGFVTPLCIKMKPFWTDLFCHS